MSVSARRREQEKLAKRAALLDAAKRLFAERGYAGTRMEDVAEAAGFSKRTVYLYFQNKDDLYVLVALAGLRELERCIEQALASGPFPQRITALQAAYLGFYRAHPQEFRMNFLDLNPAQLAGASAKARDELLAIETRCLTRIAELIREAVADGLIRIGDPWQTALTFWGLAQGLVMLQENGRHQALRGLSVETLLHDAVTTMMAGLQPAGGEP